MASTCGLPTGLALHASYWAGAYRGMDKAGFPRSLSAAWWSPSAWDPNPAKFAGWKVNLPSSRIFFYLVLISIKKKIYQ